MRMNNSSLIRLLLPVTIGAGGMFSLLTAVTAIAGIKDAFPHVGDILAFNASSPPVVDGDTRLIANRLGQFGCVLDLGVLHHDGGSLVVEARVDAASDSYRVHWAGARTTADAANCGPSADLILNGHDLDTLALSAGGYGAGPRHMPTMAVAATY